MIKLGDPVIALVDYHATGCLVRLLGRVDLHRLLKRGSSDHYVDMSVGFAGEHDRVGSLDSQCTTAKGEFIIHFGRQRGAAMCQHQARGKNPTRLHSALSFVCARRQIAVISRDKKLPGCGIPWWGFLLCLCDDF